ncbi:oxidoreductase [Streptomyces sp. SID13031]|uniref:oxidoreductase n=1 Tax=Streptomyces sp. SID13031 TaxID=2706046 RepID=UPI0013C93297|nr:oxidoreductase [Streptomyces sp. SID13031]NEA33444.1 SDR family NAD(P)-dependent oxidoreductase [Streptomyces sp. SID13031]
MSWSTSDIPDLTGRRVLVTGATSGLGYETALELLRHGAEVTIAARNPEKSQQAAASLAAASGRPQPAILDLDLADLAGVETAAERFAEKHEHLDILVNNAGVMAPPYRQTVDGFELQVGTNHLGHFALTARLMPLLLKAAIPRVVTVSSIMHKTVNSIRQGDLRAENGYAKWDAYGKSKLANLLFMLELDRRARAAGSNLTSVSSHPGYARTHLQASGPQLGGVNLEARLLAIGTKIVAQSARAGAWPSLYAATAPEVRSGSYYGPSFLEFRGKPKLVHPTKAAQNPQLAQQLWAWSVEATGVNAF